MSLACSSSTDFHLLQNQLEPHLEFRFQARGLVRAERARVDQLLFEKLRHRRPLLDFRVEIGLGEGRLVAFVVAVTAVAIHVDHHIAAEFLPKIEGQLGDEFHGERVVAIHMENRDLDHLRDVGRIHRRARVFRQRRESDLIVHDHVDGAARAVAVELRHVERLRHDALARESSVAMDEQRQNFAPQFRIAAHPLPRARGSLHDGIDRFEMARVGREANLHLGAILQLPDRAIAEVIFHIAIARHEVGDVVGGKFGEDDLQRFLQEIRQDVEPAAMGHPHANLLDPMMRTAAENRIQDHHERLRALERKAFLPDVASVQKRFERLGFEQRAQDRDLRLARSLALGRPRLEPVPDPVADARVLDVLKFRADRIGVNAFEQRDHFAQRHLAAVEKEFGRHLEVEVLLAEAELAQAQERILRTLVGQRIEPGNGVPERAVGVDESIHSRLKRTLADLRRGCAAAAAAPLR